ncbi:MAG: DUF4282 domain-containing protein [Dehalococcoidia bacterium]|nr:DUF4282 domain-containing protein [Dehalococcoidia bacterium]
MAAESVGELMVAPYSKGFLRKLFDLSFETSISTTLIKVLYLFLLVLSTLAGLGVLIGLAGAAGGVGVVLGLVLAPFVFLALVIWSRVNCELMIVLFRIADNTGEMARQTRGDQT